MSAVKSLNWKQWKRGAVVAMISGLITVAPSMLVGIGWKALVIVLYGSVGTNFFNWLYLHPIESVLEPGQIVSDADPISFDKTTLPKL